MLNYSWVFEAIILCLSYDSVFLSLLSFPPVAKIKHLSDLATAVYNGNYHCISLTPGVADYLYESKLENLRQIAENIRRNSRDGHLHEKFLRCNISMNLVFFTSSHNLDLYVGKSFIADDHFYQKIPAIPIQKRFSCKDSIGTFVYRIIASGTCLKYYFDSSFLCSF